MSPQMHLLFYDLMPLAYLGPGLGIGTILLVLLVLAIVFASILVIIWVPIKNFFRLIGRWISGS